MTEPNRVSYGLNWENGGNGIPCPNPVELQVASGHDFNITGQTADFSLRPGDAIQLTAGGLADVSDVGDPIDYVMVDVGNSGQVYDATRKRFEISPKGLASGKTYPSDNFRTRVLAIPVNGVVFEIDVDTSGVTQDSRSDYQALIGQNADLVYEPDVPELTLNPKLNLASVTTGTAQLRIVGISPSRDNEDFAQANVKMLVMVNESGRVPYGTTGV